MATPQTGKKPSFSVRRPVLAVLIIELLLLLAVFAAGAVATVKQMDSKHYFGRVQWQR
ncbi:hypothetical protein ACM7Q1_18685 [Paenibacillus illinoisensis]|uniref:hypothetical protein n=1 Tax=Paenibacillus illinoisensis TaxID=59845 RepID=UPI003A4DE764